MAAAEKKADSNVTPIDEARPKSKKTLIIAIAAVALLGGGGGAAWWMMKPQAAEAHAAKPPPPAPPVFVELEPFTVNLAGDRILQTTLSLQVKKSEDAELLKTWMPQVKSRMLLLLSAKQVDELQTPQGKETLATEIAAALKQPFAKGLEPAAIDGVFLTSFVIQ